METTLELRWFGPGRAPGHLSRRFDALGASGPDERTDSYVVLAGTDDLGVKLRDGGGALEFKLRQHDFGETKVASVRGNLERWQKWSIPVADGAGRAARLGLPADALIDVAKSRRLVTYGLTADGSAEPVEERTADGCSVEITSLDAGGSEWWSLGFEAFGTQDHLADALTAAAEAFFSPGTGLSELLAACASCGYPAWLRKLT